MTAALWEKLIDKVLSFRMAAVGLAFALIFWGKNSGLSTEQLDWAIKAILVWILSDGIRAAEMPKSKQKRLAKEALAVYQPAKVLESMKAKA